MAGRAHPRGCAHPAEGLEGIKDGAPLLEGALFDTLHIDKKASTRYTWVMNAFI